MQHLVWSGRATDTLVCMPCQELAASKPSTGIPLLPHVHRRLLTPPQVGMVFVRALNGGISHTPAELTSEQDVGAAAAALATFLEAEALDAGAQGGSGAAAEGRDEL